MSEVRQRNGDFLPKPTLDFGAGTTGKAQEPHPVGPPKHTTFVQAIRMLSFVVYFISSCLAMHAAQLIGWPLYLISKDHYYAYMAMTKQFFGLFVTTLTQWWSATTIRISWDSSMNGQLSQLPDGRLECHFPPRLIMIANHQIYTDWLYLWWIAYTNRLHGHICIILKESLKYVPVLGPGMMFYEFIFMARNWAKDKPRMQRQLRKLKTRTTGGSRPLANPPAWLIIFPEGTNLSANTRRISGEWAAKAGVGDMRHQLLPRSTGLQFCVQELRGSMEWIYDCTIAYEGVPRGSYGQDLFTLRSTYFQGRPPKSVNMYWRRFAVSAIPVDDAKAFEGWLRDRWTEKDELLEQYVQTGRFPASDEDASDGGAAGKGRRERTARSAGYLETQVKQANPLEFLQIFAPAAVYALSLNLLLRLWRSF